MELPFKLPANSRVLVAGAGGGFDVYCALPVALELKQQGHEVHLANYSFTNLAGTKNTGTNMKGLSCVTRSSVLEGGDYFPELYLSRWWHETFGEEKPVWCYSRIGVRPLSEVFQYLQDTLKLDGIVVVDGGVDGMFIGNEFDLATPSMDAVSIIAASTLSDMVKVYGFTAFGTEGAECSVRHSDVLLRISELTAKGNFLGVTGLTQRSPTGKAFIEAVEYAHRHLPRDKHSVIAGSLIEALKGKFGHCNFNVKTQTAPVWISALTSMYWFFDLDAVARAKPYLDEVLSTESVMDVANAIERTRAKLGVLPRSDIPI